MRTGVETARTAGIDEAARASAGGFRHPISSPEPHVYEEPSTTAQRWRRWPLLAGAVALVVYLLTLSRGAFPGISAALIASAAQLIPEHAPAHPCWSLVTRGLVRLPVLDLPLRLNIFSALCGAAAVALFGSLVSRWVFQSVSEDGDVGDTWPLEDGDSDEDGAQLHLRADSDTVSRNRRASVAALLGGCAAALVLAFCVPFWSIATRFTYQSFTALFLIGILQLVLRYAATERPWLAWAAAFLCGLGCVESTEFIPLTAALFVLFFFRLIRRGFQWERTLLRALLATAAGAGLGLLLYGLQSGALRGAPTAVWPLGMELLRTHWTALRHSLPRTGWIWVVLLAYAPVAVALLTGRSSFHRRPALAHLLLQLFLTVAVLLCLIDTSVSPWSLARNSGDVPIMAYLAAAAVAGYLVAYWILLGVSDETTGNRVAGDDDPADDFDKEASCAPVQRWVAISVGGLFLIGVGILPFVNLREADGRQGAFADATAQAAVAQLGRHDWMASNGLLDCHLLLAGRAQGRPLHLLSLASGANPLRVRQLQGWIDTDPVFAANRERLRIDAGLGIPAFLHEWLRDATFVEDRLTVAGTSLLWKKAGWHPVPNGLVYGGTRHPERLDGAGLLASNRLFWARLAVTLAPSSGAPPALDGLRVALRQQVSRVANDLGVLLQDLGRDDEAYEAYAASRRFVPDNLSALINQFALAERGIHPDDKAELEKALRARGRDPLPPLPAAIETYGDVRAVDAFVLKSRAWERSGQTAMAIAELDRAIALAPESTNAQYRLAALYLVRGDAAASERVYRELLAANPTNTAVLIDLASVALASGRLDEARQWMDQARRVGGPAETLVLCEAALLALTAPPAESIPKLRALVDQHPRNIAAWSVLADVLLQEKAFLEVEQNVLPAMCKAAGTDQVIIHLVRARLLGTRSPVNFDGAHAAYLNALKLKPNLAGVRHDLLMLDLRVGNLAWMEFDAAQVLSTEPDDALANYVLALSLLSRNDLARAEKHFRRSLVSRETGDALNDLAETLRRQRRLDEAEQVVRRALARNAGFCQAWDTLGCILLDGGKTGEAVQAIEQALALCKTDARFYVSLARARVAQARPDQARQALREMSACCLSIPESVGKDAAALDRQLGIAGKDRP